MLISSQFCEMVSEFLPGARSFPLWAGLINYDSSICVGLLKKKKKKREQFTFSVDHIH